MQKTSAKLSLAVKNQFWINNWLNLEFPFFFNTSCTFWSNSILFQSLEYRFHNSTLSIPCGNPAHKWHAVRNVWKPLLDMNTLQQNCTHPTNKAIRRCGNGDRIVGFSFVIEPLIQRQLSSSGVQMPLAQHERIVIEFVRNGGRI